MLLPSPVTGWWGCCGSADGEVEVPGRFGQLQGGEDGLLPGGGQATLRDVAGWGGEGDQGHAVEFVADVAPGVGGWRSR